ncbi:hypothetical protein ANCDUO_18268 [Ancylostoma duodenale]|uniref:Uncharacterized protein n=1 Tax=Ancylostoma duodenale TaxID=51022 RepID=A0A0C2FYB2_9BILA|nr:hypothetical protein ANCDUO_18268 [Ancylostoma duodenale]
MELENDPAEESKETNIEWCRRLASALAIAFMTRIELGMLFCCRRIDDCFVVYAIQAEIGKRLDSMNEQGETIRLTRNNSEDDWVPFRNM